MLDAETLKRLEDLITIEDVKEIFEIQTDATIHKWRVHENLDQYVIRIPGRGRDVIRFELDDVIQWADENGRSMPGLGNWRAANRPKE